jgi:AcrR family transcriptional regulator
MAAVTPLDMVRARRGGRSARVRDAVLAATREELMDGSYASLSHLAVARAAGVDPATVYRRWPTRARLAVDALIELAAEAVPVPDTGALRGDFEAFHLSLVGLLDDPRLVRLFKAFSAAMFDEDADVAEALEEFWRDRYDGATAMLERAEARGEIPSQRDPHGVLEQLVAPAYYRTLVTRRPLDRRLGERSLQAALTLARDGS